MCKSNLQSASSPLYSHLLKHKHTHTNTPNTHKYTKHTTYSLTHTKTTMPLWSERVDRFFFLVSCVVTVVLWCWCLHYLPFARNQLELGHKHPYPICNHTHPFPPFMHKRRYQITHEKKSKCRGRHHACLPRHTLTHHNSPTQHR